MDAQLRPPSFGRFSVTNGLFVLSLDFGAATFNGEARWLQLDVRTNNAPNYTALSLRQPITPRPYAIHASKAGDLQSGGGPTFSGP